MKSARMVIEKNYGQMANIFRICGVSDNYRLAKINPYAVEQYRICSFLTNCYICFNGDQAGSVNTFGISPPTIEQYLFYNSLCYFYQFMCVIIITKWQTIKDQADEPTSQ
jgi:hypothetical protein